MAGSSDTVTSASDAAVASASDAGSSIPGYREFFEKASEEIARCKAAERERAAERENMVEDEVEFLKVKKEIKEEPGEEADAFQGRLIDEANRRVAVSLAKREDRKAREGEKIIFLRCNTPPFQSVKEEPVEEAPEDIGETLGLLLSGIDDRMSDVWDRPLASADLTHLCLD